MNEKKKRERGEMNEDNETEEKKNVLFLWEIFFVKFFSFCFQRPKSKRKKTTGSTNLVDMFKEKERERENEGDLFE